jgi:hypothetical protein
MMELVKKNIHMNRWKGNATSQITLDDDLIVPDTMDDMDQIILDSGEITIESVKNQAERVVVRGKLDFHVLYRKAEGGLQTLGGSISFEEPINVPGLEEKDYVQLGWELDDLNTGMINSRKLSIKAIVTLEVKVETLYDVEAAVEVDTGTGSNCPQVEILRRNADAAAIALRHKDTYRIKDNIQLSGNKPNIDRILWNEMKLRGVTARPLDGKMVLDGEIMVFLIYNGEGEEAPVQWLEESIPFSGELDLPDATDEMVPSVNVHLIHKDIEAKPDYDGEMREMEVDAVLELDIKLYREENMELLSDLYSTNRELNLQTGEVCFDRILTKNMSKCKLAEKVNLENADRILQICHSEGMVKIDETQVMEDGLQVEGILEVRLLYLTADDTQPIQASVEVVPFHYIIEAPGINNTTICQLVPGLEQMNAVMMGGGNVEVKATISLDLLALQPVCEQVIISASDGPMDLKKLQELPGIVGYIVQPEDSLWNIAKKFHTTIDNIMATNGLADRMVKPGERLVLVKEI